MSVKGGIKGLKIFKEERGGRITGFFDSNSGGDLSSSPQALEERRLLRSFFRGLPILSRKGRNNGSQGCTRGF